MDNLQAENNVALDALQKILVIAFPVLEISINLFSELGDDMTWSSNRRITPN